MQNLNRKHWILFYAIGIGLLFLSALSLFDLHQPLSISVLDVGQGDSILIQTPEYYNVLIDAGSDSLAVDQLGERLSYFDKTVDLFILTHPHRDHHGGILDIMQKYDIKTLLLTGVHSGDPLYKAFLDKAKSDGINIIFNQSHQDIQISPNVYLDILYPFEGQSLVGQDSHNKNNTSIVARLVRRTEDDWQSLAMLTGDAEHEEELAILLSGQDLSSDILKIGHHGSRTATSDAFLAAVNPTTAIVSAGRDNKFEHPHPETLEKLRNLEVYQTMVDGMVVFDF